MKAAESLCQNHEFQLINYIVAPYQEYKNINNKHINIENSTNLNMSNCKKRGMVMDTIMYL